MCVKKSNTAKSRINKHTADDQNVILEFDVFLLYCESSIIGTIMQDSLMILLMWFLYIFIDL